MTNDRSTGSATPAPTHTESGIQDVPKNKVLYSTSPDGTGNLYFSSALAAASAALTVKLEQRQDPEPRPVVTVYAYRGPEVRAYLNRQRHQPTRNTSRNAGDPSPLPLPTSTFAGEWSIDPQEQPPEPRQLTKPGTDHQPVTCKEFNPAHDRPRTAAQRDLVRAFDQAQDDWFTVGGPLIDQIEDKERTVTEGATTLYEQYGVSFNFWYRHIRDVIEDRNS